MDKAVGKVGNNSPSFVVPVDSKENKKNIANFFGKQKETAKDVAAKNQAAEKEEAVRHEDDIEVEHEDGEDRATSKVEDPETGAPLPKPKDEPDEDLERAIKASTPDLDDGSLSKAADEQIDRGIKREISEVEDAALLMAAESPPAEKVAASPSPVKSTPASKMRSATKNEARVKSPQTTEGNAKITAFFGK